MAVFRTLELRQLEVGGEKAVACWKRWRNRWNGGRRPQERHMDLKVTIGSQ
jgi:hypothetical protein